jgi:predicted XRE-type DNA-binding protein
MRPVLLAILAAGVRQAEIARKLGVSRACISDAAKPSDRPWMPSYATGVALLSMLEARPCDAGGAPAHA